MDTVEIIAITSAVALALLFVIAGIFLLRGKCLWLVAGYNTMSAKKKEKYDQLALGKFMGKVFFAFAVIVPAIMLGSLFHIPILMWIAVGLVVALVIFMIIFANTNQRFIKEKYRGRHFED